jgi:hypothetical protein
MLIRDLFKKDINRHIEGVIKADDERDLLNEVEEYVITGDVADGLDKFLENYTHHPLNNGVWISGYFGSGKSHLLKILSLVLDGRPLGAGASAGDIFLPKIDDEIRRADMRKAVKIPSRSILFNIDQKFDGIGGDHTAPILEVFVKVFDELRGYYGKQGYIAKFEADLDEHNQFAAFKETYLRVNGSPWERDRDALATAKRKAFINAYTTHFNLSESDATNFLKQMRDDYRISPAEFAEQVKKYIDKQPPGFRLNFFVDEVGQFIAQDTGRMLNLQTIAESLATKCKGQAWVFCTAQADLGGILGEMSGVNADQISKILGRFPTQITLKSADVQEVIQKRLLAKQQDEPEVLTSVYDREKENLSTLFRFSDGGFSHKGWRGSDAFCGSYPFPPYQSDLFQIAIQQFSRHGAFTGKYRSVGERSMLEVFHQSAKTVSSAPVGALASFDLLYDGISASIRGDFQTSIGMAARTLGDGYPIRVLKALFLLKWVREFKATPQNIAILLIDQVVVDIRKHLHGVQEALNLLESQSFLQRNGDAYEFLTDIEKDIEVEIKNTEIESSNVSKLLTDILFADILRDPKIRYENGQDYAYARRLDDQLVGRDADFAINIVTPEHDNHGDLQTLAAQNTGKAELLVILPSDARVIDEARLHLKTLKYIQQNTGANLDESRKAILTQRGTQNSARRSQLQSLCADLLGKAPLYLNGSRLADIGEGDARNRISKASQTLVSFAYPSLRMLRGTYDEAGLSKTLLDSDDLLPGTPLTDAEQEVLTYVLRNQNSGERMTVEEILRHFQKRPYGWYPLAVLTQLARLLRIGKIELRAPEILSAKAALEALKNTRQHGSIRVRLQEQFDQTKVDALKRFHQEFFDRACPGTDARSVATAVADACESERGVLQNLVSQKGRYPFLSQLEAVCTQLENLAGKEPSYLLTQLAEFSGPLLDAKDDLLVPIKAFMNGQQRVTYDEAVAFLREEEANFSGISSADLEPLRQLSVSQTPFRGNVVPQAKAAVAKVRTTIQEQIQAERQAALDEIERQEARVKELPQFAALPVDQQQLVLSKSHAAREAIQNARFISSVRDRLHSYSSTDYPAQLSLATSPGKPASPYEEGAPKGTSVKDEPAYIPFARLRPKCALPYLASEDDVEVWIESLRKTALEEVQKGNRISL